MRLLVETRSDERCGPFLDECALWAEALGHDVIRFRNEAPRTDFDSVILWNGQHPVYDSLIQHLHETGKPAIYVELGWLPQDGTFQVDTEGVNCEASWLGEDIPSTTTEMLKCRDGDLLICLQTENDMQIRRHSPHFQNMATWLHTIQRNSALPLRVRFHPLAHPVGRIWNLLLEHEIPVDDSETVDEAFEGAAAVAVINSTCGFQAIEAGLPVLCFGEALYRRPFLVYLLRNGIDIQQATEDVRDKRCHLSPVLMQNFIEVVKSKQWTLEDVRYRLGPMLRGN